MQYRPHFLQLLHLYPQERMSQSTSDFLGSPKPLFIFWSNFGTLRPWVDATRTVNRTKKSYIILMIRFQSLDVTYIFKNLKIYCWNSCITYLSYWFEFEFFAQLTKNKNAIYLNLAAFFWYLCRACSISRNWTFQIFAHL